MRTTQQPMRHQSPLCGDNPPAPPGRAREVSTSAVLTRTISATPAAMIAAVGAAITILSALATPAAAQNALGDGRALDRNLNPTGGRTNPAAPSIEQQIRFNNAAFEGRAGAGRSFQGSVGARSTSEFRGSLGTSTLFSFERDAASAGQASIPGIRTSDALRYQFDLATGAASPSAGAMGLGMASRVGDVATGASAASLRSTAQYTATAALLPTVLGYGGDEKSGRVAMIASPLRGISPVRLSEAGGALSAPLSGLERVTPGVLSPSEFLGSINPATARGPGNQDSPGSASPFVVGDPAAERARFDRLPDSLRTELDRKLGLGLGPVPVQPIAAPAPGSVRVINPASTPPAAGPNPPGWGPAPAASPTAPTSDPLLPNANQLAPRAADVLSQIARLRGELAGIRPKPSQPGDAPGSNSGSTTGDTRQIVRELAGISLKIDSMKPAFATDTYGIAMARGQDAILDGRWFDAEGAFGLALSNKPGDALAKAGRIHAQLGAGLMLSAATNLRQYLAEHPEMVGSVFDSKLLPLPARASMLATLLRADADKPDPAIGRDGALLLAYMGQQYQDADWLNTGLKRLRDRTPADDAAGQKLIELVSAAWKIQPRDATVPNNQPVPAAPASAPPGDK